jgi:uncharacterized protein (DUF427 family)
MSRSPGHQEHPEHKVKELRASGRVKVEWNGAVVADSADALRVEETGNPPRYYFPRSDVVLDKLERTATTSHCPFKGDAHYFSLVADGARLDDAVWTYEDPYEEHPALKDRLAFWTEKSAALKVHAG